MYMKFNPNGFSHIFGAWQSLGSYLKCRLLLPSSLRFIPLRKTQTPPVSAEACDWPRIHLENKGFK